ncbi:MAG: ABC transporter ATP-binding protein [Candidatus Latescibacteria bacterium]|nr:ABC transporter ATP-binding protein [Candidatus Latescibacterota bacterium]
MSLTDPIPEAIQRKLNTCLEADEELRLAIESDVDNDGRFNPRWLITTDRRVMTVDLNGGKSDIAISLKDIQKVHIHPLVGGGMLEVSTFSDTVPLISYTQSKTERFVEASRGIEQLVEEKPFQVRTKFAKTKCDSCGRRLPSKDALCPACVSKWDMFKRIATYMTNHTGKVLLMAGMFLITTLADLVPPKITQLLIDEAFPQKDTELLFWYVVALGSMMLIRWIAEMVYGWLSAWLGARVVADIRSEVYRHLELLSLGYHDKMKTGGLLSRVTSDTRNLRHFLVDGLPYLVLRWLMCIGVVTMLFYTNWLLTIYILLPVPIIIYWGAQLFKRLRVSYYRLWRRWEDFYNHIQETLSAIRVVKAFAQEPREVKRFQRNTQALFEIGYWTERKWIFYFSTMGLFTFLGFAIVWLVGGRQVLGEELTVGELMLFYFYLHMFYGPLRWLGRVNSWMTRAMSAAERIFEIMDTEPESYNDPKSIAMPNVRGDISFQDVTFGYEAALPVLKEVSLDIHAGEMVGLVGKSGAGKTTTINLICRFYDVNYGAVLLDGVDIRDIRLEDVRSHIGVVMQDPILFNGTIGENISYGNPDASFELVIAAARAANAHNFILGKPDGYDTVLGEKGTGLSGGEKQRVSIARAVLHDPSILILDEATSSVDAQTEKLLQEAIGRLTKGRTTIAIAHRLSTLRDASRLVVLDQGKLVEQGTHEELMKKHGHFHHLVQLQQMTSEIMVVN